MAQEVQIRGAGSTAKIRDVIAVTVLTFVTLGIYGVVWYYKVNREMADYGKAHLLARAVGLHAERPELVLAGSERHERDQPIELVNLRTTW